MHGEVDPVRDDVDVLGAVDVVHMGLHQVKGLYSLPPVQGVGAHGGDAEAVDQGVVPLGPVREEVVDIFLGLFQAIGQLVTPVISYNIVLRALGCWT